MPNFVAVNWYGQGDLLDVVNTLNGVEPSQLQAEARAKTGVSGCNPVSSESRVPTQATPARAGARCGCGNRWGGNDRLLPNRLWEAIRPTRIRTFKQEEVSIPNSVVMNASVVNYSTQARTQGVILYTSVTIGYDVPWRTVHELLLSAAAATSNVLADPPPFVLQPSLNDYSVTYQLNCYTNRTDIMPQLYSDLHRNILDQFNAAGVEIMSPAFTALRDGNTTTIPEENRPAEYRAPDFRLDHRE